MHCSSESLCRVQSPRTDDVTTESCKVTWRALRCECLRWEARQSGYFLFIRCVEDGKGMEWRQWQETAVKDTEAVVDTLTPGSSYQFCVSIANEKLCNRQSALSETVHAIELPKSPSQPRIIAYDTSTCTLTWDEPEQDEISPVTEYFVEFKREGGPGWIWIDTPIHCTTYHVKNLNRSSFYQFRITAGNSKGHSKTGMESVTVETISLPKKVPEIEVLSVTHQSCSLSWTRPEDDGGTDILYYVIEAKANDGKWEERKRTKTGREYSCRLEGLEEDTYYTLSVLAANKLGHGEHRCVTDKYFTKGYDLHNTEDLEHISVDDLLECGVEELAIFYHQGLRSMCSIVERVNSMSSFIHQPQLYTFKRNLEQLSAWMKNGFGNAKELAAKITEKIANSMGSTKQQSEDCKYKLDVLSGKLKENLAKLKELKRKQTKVQRDLYDCQSEVEDAERQLTSAKERFDRVSKKWFIWLFHSREYNSARQEMDDALENLSEKNISLNSAYDIAERHDLILQKAKEDCTHLQEEVKELEDTYEDLETEYSNLSEIDAIFKECYFDLSVDSDGANLFEEQLKVLYNMKSMFEHLKSLGRVFEKLKCDIAAVDFDMIDWEGYTAKLNMLTSVEWNSLLAATVMRRDDILTKLEKPEDREQLQEISAFHQGLEETLGVEGIMMEQSLVHVRHLGLENLLLPLPKAIAVQGQLMLVATAKDFSLSECWPTETTSHVRSPESFQACLIELSNDTWEAFKTAHLGMRRLCEYSQIIPQHMSVALELLQNGRQDELCHLSGPLNALQQISTKCSEVAVSTEEDFFEIIEILSQLTQVIVSCKSDKVCDRQDIQAAAKASQIRLERAKEKHATTAHHFKEIQQQILEKEKELEKSKEAMPSKWTLFFYKVLDVMSVSVFNVLRDGIKIGIAKASHAYNHQQSASQYTQEILETAQYLHAYMTDLGCYLAGKDIDTDELKINDNYKVVRILVEDEVQKIAKLKKNKEAVEVKKLCDRVTEMCDTLESYAEGMNQSASKETALKLQTLKKDCTMYFEKCAKDMNTMNAPLPPTWSDALPSVLKGKGTANSVKDMYTERIEVAEKMLEIARADYKQQFEVLMQTSEKMADEIGKMALCKVENLKAEEIILVISKSIEFLCDIKVQWGKIVSCFQSVSSILDNALNVTLDKFITGINVSASSNLSGYSLSAFRRNVLYMEVVQVACVCQQIQFIAENYTTVSEKYIMPRVGHLNQLLIYHPTRDKHEVERKITELRESSEHDELEIRRILTANMEEFCSQIQRRIELTKLYITVGHGEDKNQEHITTDMSATELEDYL